MKNEIIIFENQGIKLEVNLKDETVWLNINQISKLFDRDKSDISRHIKNSLKEECSDSVVANFATTANDGKRVIDNNTLVAMTLLIAQSNPKEKEILINLVMNFLV